MKMALAQIAPVWLDREKTLEKVAEWVGKAADAGADLVCFGESLVPGYPVWLDRVDGARFENDELKDMHAYFAERCVVVGEHLEGVCAAARDGGIAVMLGVTERAPDRGGHSLYCSRVFIDADGNVPMEGGVHRKLVPTYEERLVWGHGDGAGLHTFDVSGFRVGGLNCWENWIPLNRAALHAQGEDLHIMVWPGADRLTKDITRFVAYEGRQYTGSVSGLLRATDIPTDVPLRDRIVRAADELIHNGGSAAAGPDGNWLLEPRCGEEGLYVVELDPREVRRARQAFDYSGHYGRPEILRLDVDRSRHGVWYGDA